MKSLSTADQITTVPSAEGPHRRGRRRDADIDQRILDAATLVYAERGWTGFNFDAVAHRAKVSKDAMYRRYTDPVQLLVSTWSGAQRTDNHQYEDGLPAKPDIRSYLFAVSKDHFAMFSGRYGFDHLRVYVEAKHHPEVLKAFSEVQEKTISRVRRAVRKAMDAGLLPQVSSPTAMIDALVGGVAMHIMSTPPRLRGKMLEESEHYLTELVDLILRGCGYDFSNSPDRMVTSSIDR